MSEQKVFTPEKRAEFLAVMRETCNVTLAAKAAGITRQRAYKIREAEPDFAELWDNALQEGIDVLEQEVHRRAFRGVDEPVFYQGFEVGAVRKYSDTLAIFLLKAHRPEKYRENTKVELTGANGGPVELNDNQAAARLAAIMANAEARKKAEEGGHGQ